MEPSNPDYLDWKKRFELDQKKSKKDFFRRAVLVFGGIIAISSFIYFWSIGSFQFIFSETKEVEAFYVEVNDFHIGRGLYIPRVTVEYFHEGKRYVTYENITDASKHQPKFGEDTVYVSAFVTYDIDNPKNCRVRLEFD